MRTDVKIFGVSDNEDMQKIKRDDVELQRSKLLQYLLQRWLCCNFQPSRGNGNVRPLFR